MDYMEKQAFLKNAFKALKKAGAVKFWYDFAELLDMNQKCLSAAKNGNEAYLTDNLMEKVRDCMEKYVGYEQSNHQNIINSPNAVAVQGDNNTISPEQKGTPMAGYVQKLVPTIPIKAYRAVDFDVMRYFDTTEEYVHKTPIIAQFPQTDCYYFVNSDDMSPNLHTNDLLCLSRIPSLNHITNGDLCVINTRYNGMLERFVYDDEDALILKSTQPRWTDMRIKKEDIFSVFRILGGIRTNI